MAKILSSMVIERYRSRGLVGCMARIAGWFLDRGIDGGREGMHAMHAIDTICLKKRRSFLWGCCSLLDCCWFAVWL